MTAMSQDAGAQAPLAGVRVADFSWVIAAPICGRYLAAMGAEVIKIETARRPDQTRGGAFGGDGLPRLNQSPNFNSNNYSKRGCTLDLTRPEAQQLARMIVSQSDVVLENFGFGVMERFGLSYETLVEIRPDVVMLSSSGMGRTGPDRAYVAYGQTLHAFSGLTSLTGYADGPPRGVGFPWSDQLTAITGAFAVLAALHHRAETGEGQFIDVSMAEATALPLMEPLIEVQLNGGAPGPRGSDDGSSAPHACYRCSGADSWIAIAVATDAEWHAVCGVLGARHLIADSRFTTQRDRWQHRNELDAALNELTAAWDARMLTEALQAAGVAAGPSLNVDELLLDPHLQQRGLLHTVEHPETGLRTICRLPWKTEPPIAERYVHAPLLGQDNDYVFLTLLGLEASTYTGLLEDKVIW